MFTATPKPNTSPEHGQSPGPGVRYITEDLIKKISGHDHLPTLTTLNLTLSKEGGKKIKV
jgi:centriolin